MNWWILICAMQTAYMFLPPVRYWWPYYRTYRCWKNKCRCMGMFSLHDVPPNIKQAIKDDTITFDFINSAWNYIEEKNMSARQREIIDVQKYFNGYRGPR